MTATARALADIVADLSQQRDARDQRSPAERALDRDPADDASPPSTAGAAAMPSDAFLATLLADVGKRIDDEVERRVSLRTAAVEADYRSKLQRLRALTNEEIRLREAAVRRAVARENQDTAQLLRGYYEQLMALADTIARQKAQLVEARRQFEHKLASADRLYRDIEDMRRLLDEQITYLDQQPIEEPPRLSLSL
ncbi:MAG: hypothetical protein H6977_03300 [Gammaproteobacteria bacterium]|nr:hypothetical protein [Gammaproteobacteria bacterium]